MSFMRKHFQRFCRLRPAKILAAFKRLLPGSHKGRASSNPNIVTLDTCDWLLSEESFQRFTSNFFEDYKRLIRGLDDESLLVVGRILSRIRQFRESRSNQFWFSEFERTELLRIYDLHSGSILKISDECFAYGRYFLPRNIICTTVFFYHHFIPALRDLAAVRGRDIIDVGGFIGDSALILSQYTDHHVHVFEPVSSLYALAQKTVEMNGLSNVILNKVALGDKEGTTRIADTGDTSSVLSAESRGDGVVEDVPMTTLDAYVARHNLRVGLIKVDVEGFEQAFLRGAMETIKSQRPALLLSIYHNADDFFKIKPMIEDLNLGYTFKIKKPSDLSIIVDTTLIAEVSA